MAALLAMTGAEEKAVSRNGGMGRLRPKAGVDGGLKLTYFGGHFVYGVGYKVRERIARVGDWRWRRRKRKERRKNRLTGRLRWFCFAGL